MTAVQAGRRGAVPFTADNGRRHVGEGFEELLFCAPRRRDLVSDEVVDGRESQRRSISQIYRLNGRRPVGEDAWPGAAEISRQIDKYLDFVGADAPGGLFIAQCVEKVHGIKDLISFHVFFTPRPERVAN